MKCSRHLRAKPRAADHRALPLNSPRAAVTDDHGSRGQRKHACRAVSGLPGITIDDPTSTTTLYSVLPWCSH